MASEQITTINPATGEEITTYDTMSSEDIDYVLTEVTAAQRTWSGTAIEQRAAVLLKTAQVLRDARPSSVPCDLRDGQADRRGEAEVEKCAWDCDYYAEHAPALPRRRASRTGAPRSYVALRAARHRARDHAVELPVLAGLPLRRAGADGRQRRRCSSTPRTSPACALAIEDDLPRRRPARRAVPHARRRRTRRARATVDGSSPTPRSRL